MASQHPPYIDGHGIESLLGSPSFLKVGTDKIEQIPTYMNPVEIVKCSQIEQLLESAIQQIEEAERELERVYKPNETTIFGNLLRCGYSPKIVKEVVGYLNECIKPFYSSRASSRRREEAGKVRALMFLLENMDPNRKDYRIIAGKIIAMYKHTVGGTVIEKI